MEYTHHPYYNPDPQAYSYLGLPTTTAGTNNVDSDNFGDSAIKAQDPFDQGYSQLSNYAQFEQQAHQALNGSGNGIMSDSSSSIHNAAPEGALNGSLGNAKPSDPDDQIRRSSSEEKELTPAQSRRKEQNRAAQRAFRERKERHVKELEIKLTSMQQALSTMQADKERLERELHHVSMENELLRSTNGNSSNGGAHAQSDPNHHSANVTVGPMRFSPVDFTTSLQEGHRASSASAHRVTVSERTGERLLAAGAAWDIIVEHPLFKKGLVDIGDVCERLKRITQCDGQGPVFGEGEVMRAIEASAASGSDELI
ncbi:hypothetical protein L228DRAFT_264022 [Xylona heveae TC161]|uniref:BZIP domain-containing protein n=1 Tax=Xylona heveae (strain CBS 132557 / TC161) TaxID=1328760 RepID=A0A164ZMA3_XYLHT|nr:hypothetical protein L228DRAFT_264022 [Xylona heveae TC161]KZF19273.1 hypothetical protein L228DRAFT_264022 [Xylona heveae TC161]